MLSILITKKKEGGHRRLLEVMDMSITLTVVTVSQCGMHISKLIKLYALSMCSFYINHISIKLLK